MKWNTTHVISAKTFWSTVRQQLHQLVFQKSADLWPRIPACWKQLFTARRFEYSTVSWSSKLLVFSRLFIFEDLKIQCEIVRRISLKNYLAETLPLNRSTDFSAPQPFLFRYFMHLLLIGFAEREEIQKETETAKVWICFSLFSEALLLCNLFGFWDFVKDSLKPKATDSEKMYANKYAQCRHCIRCRQAPVRFSLNSPRMRVEAKRLASTSCLLLASWASEKKGINWMQILKRVIALMTLETGKVESHCSLEVDTCLYTPEAKQRCPKENT